MKVSIVAAAAAFAVLALSSVAGATKPDREVILPGPDFTINDCGFPVFVHTEGTTIRKTFTDADGNAVRQIETYPGLRWTLTNVGTGATLSTVIPGPLILRFNADGTTTFKGTGPWGWFGGHPGTGEAGIFLLKGHITQTIDAAGNVTSTFNGKTVDLCAQLSP